MLLYPKQISKITSPNQRGSRWLGGRNRARFLGRGLRPYKIVEAEPSRLFSKNISRGLPTRCRAFRRFSRRISKRLFAKKSRTWKDGLHKTDGRHRLTFRSWKFTCP